MRGLKRWSGQLLMVRVPGRSIEGILEFVDRDVLVLVDWQSQDDGGPVEKNETRLVLPLSRIEYAQVAL